MEKDFLKYLRDKKEEMLSLLIDFVRIESPTGNKRSITEAADFLCRLIKSLLKIEAQKIDADRYGKHVLVEIGCGSEQVLVLGHFDTVHPVGTVKKNKCRFEDYKLYGPGIYDMKTGIIQSLFAISAMLQKEKLNKRVVCLFNCDEEIGSINSASLIEKIAKNSKVAFVLEPSEDLNGTLKTSRRGVGTYKVEAYGVASHSGKCPERGVNAIEEIARQILYLQGLNDPIAGIGVNCGLVKGGVAKNMIADYAETTVDLRISRRTDAVIGEKILALKPFNPEIRLEIKGNLSRFPMEQTVGNKELFMLAQKIWAKYGLGALKGCHAGGASDGNITSQFIPTLDGLGAVGDGAHSLNEWIDTRQLIPRTNLLALLIGAC